MTPATLVIIVSDGLNAGDTPQLERAMHEIDRRSAGIVWLNPLSATPGYLPSARGIRAVLPYGTLYTAANDAAGPTGSPAFHALDNVPATDPNSVPYHGRRPSKSARTMNGDTELFPEREELLTVCARRQIAYGNSLSSSMPRKAPDMFWLQMAAMLGWVPSLPDRAL